MMRPLAFLFIASSVAGCQRNLSPAEQAKWTADSSRYEVQLAKWIRDSTVVDSISRIINTDSLYRIMHATLKSAKPSTLLQAANCETDRLSRKYGQLPFDAAYARLKDTVWRGIPKAEVDALDSRLANMSVGEMFESRFRPSLCGGGPLLNSLGGTALDASAGRPAPPIRP
jgi:hypothetical protein